MNELTPDEHKILVDAIQDSATVVHKGRKDMNTHCKDCKYHHSANHPSGSNLGPRYNDWCVKFSNTARDVIGHCKLKQGKVLK